MYGSRNFSSAPATKPRMPVSMLTMFSSMPSASASTAYVWSFHFTVSRSMAVLTTAVAMSANASARMAANVSVMRFLRDHWSNMGDLPILLVVLGVVWVTRRD
jgi:hypothetical protein